MTKNIENKNHTPMFKNPPLNEVVLGVQYSSPPGYQQILAGNVWEKFKKDYPLVQEQQALPPSFETFGSHFQSAPMPQFSFSTGGVHDRFWFSSPDNSELIQFQQDRFFHNWRKSGADGKNYSYPHYHAIEKKLEDELIVLQGYMSSLTSHNIPLVINQCEVSYINHIILEKDQSLSTWLSFVDLRNDKPNDFTCVFREVIYNENKKPIARLYVEASQGFLPNGKDVISLSLSVKGAPEGQDIKSALDFLRIGHDVIVRKFAALTSEHAHKEWGRTQGEIMNVF